MEKQTLFVNIIILFSNRITDIPFDIFQSYFTEIMSLQFSFRHFKSFNFEQLKWGLFIVLKN